MEELHQCDFDECLEKIANSLVDHNIFSNST